MSDLCRNTEWLAAYIDKRLSAEERLLYENHLSACNRCLGELITVNSELREISAALAEDGAGREGAPFPAKGTVRFRPPLIIFRSFNISALNAGRSPLLAVSAALLLVVTFVGLISSPDYDPYFIHARSNLRTIMESSTLGDLRLCGGKTAPDGDYPEMRGFHGTNTSLMADTEAALRRTQRKYPGRTEVIKMLGDLYLIRNQPERSRIFYEKVLDLNPGDPSALNNLAVVAYRTGDNALALEFLEQAVTARNTRAETFYNLALLHHELGNEVRARNFLDTYLRLDSRSPWAGKAVRALRD
ncbi:MAG: tetratricopeptide repeat protein [Candidatus Krumholzibacteriota bacterium]|nr:tetratricopeptide repeat protein [Candidatus Krumholzibacteriota bacterium]